MAAEMLWITLVSAMAMVSAISATHDGPVSALFVFGDSYADTGNHDPADPSSNAPWKPPYGSTWPGIPTGRYSDGRVLTDYFAANLGVTNPIPYRAANISISCNPTYKIVDGVNFAYGGSGVFPTYGPASPNISIQINLFKSLLQGQFISEVVVKSSMVLFVIAGNDYSVYGNQHPNNEGITKFIPMVVQQMKLDLKTLYDLGFRRFTVTNIEPFGCFPQNYNSKANLCDEKQNANNVLHNTLLRAAILDLQKTLRNSTFKILDLYGAFLQLAQGNSIKTKLNIKSCCTAIGNGTCGGANANGKPSYAVCSSPRKYFFWDTVHPSNQGWRLVSKIIFKL